MQIALNLHIVKCQIFHTKKMSPFEPQSEKVYWEWVWDVGRHLGLKADLL